MDNFKNNLKQLKFPSISIEFLSKLSNLVQFPFNAFGYFVDNVNILSELSKSNKNYTLNIKLLATL